MKKLVLLIVMVMVFTSGSVVSAQYHPDKVKWYGKCSRESAKQRRFLQQFTKETVRYGKCSKSPKGREGQQVHKRIQREISAQLHPKRQRIANWHKVQKQAKRANAKRQRMLARHPG